MTSMDVPPAITVQTFMDEYGAIDSQVHETAQTLWPKAERDSQQTLHDTATGWRLLMKASALVTRKLATSPDTISNLKGYLYRTWQRLLLEELEKETLHRRIEEDLATETNDNQPANSVRQLDRQILLKEIIARMDDWTRRVFEYQTLGFTFDEIARELGGNGHAIRVRYDRQIKLLAQQFS
ncbi:MAG: hypothetical protein ACKVZH_28940 [Blastocatellia bacterium]